MSDPEVREWSFTPAGVIDESEIQEAVDKALVDEDHKTIVASLLTNLRGLVDVHNALAAEVVTLRERVASMQDVLKAKVEHPHCGIGGSNERIE